MKVVQITKNYVAEPNLLVKVNEQYEWIETTTKKIYCGCGSSGYKNIDFYKVKYTQEKNITLDSRVSMLINRSEPEGINPMDQYLFGRGDQKAGRNYDEIISRPNIEAILEQVNNIPLVKKFKE
jgi:hypothetical protein